MKLPARTAKPANTTAPRTSRLRRILILLISGSVLLCLAAAGLSAISNFGLPTRSSVVDRLADGEKARLAEAIHLRKTLGNAVWPGWGNAEIPLIVYNESYAFLVGYPDPPPGWVKVPGDARRGGPWQVVPGDTFAGQPYYRQALPDPETTPQAFVVRIGERWVASMTTYEWTRIKLASEMRGNVPAPFDAIVPYRLAVGLFNSDWHIVALEHESFHAYQGTLAPDKLLAAETANQRHADDYPWGDGDFRTAWQAELALLAQAAQASAPAEAAALAAEFLASRDARRAEHGLADELAGFERQREWLEGLAKYAELQSWRHAATTPGYQPLPAMAADPDFRAYQTFEQRWSAEFVTMRNQASSHGDGRFYYSGWAQAVLLDRLLPGWQTRALDEGVWLEDLLREAAGP